VVSIAIVGAGPSGLTLAHLLSAYPQFDVTLFEAGPRPGGKSHTVLVDQTVCEMGTCYTTRGDRHLRDMMAEAGIRSGRIGKAKMDGKPFEAFVKGAGGAPLSFQVLKFLRLRKRVMNAYAARPDDPHVLAELAEPVGAWLRRHKLPKMERFCLKALTVMGYGYVDNTPLLHALRWIDRSLIISGVLNDLCMPETGWSDFWQRIGEGKTIFLNEPVRRIDRHGDGVNVSTDHRSAAFDRVVCAMPVDDFSTLTEPTPEEAFVTEGVEWGGYATTLCAVDGWFTAEQSRNYSDALTASKLEGMLLSARREGYAEELNGHLYLLGQIPGGYSADELAEIASARIGQDGGQVTSIIEQRVWKYFPKYKAEAIRGGLLDTMQRMQGTARTYYTGSTFCHEAVGRILLFNSSLTEQIVADGAAAEETRLQRPQHASAA